MTKRKAAVAASGPVAAAGFSLLGVHVASATSPRDGNQARPVGVIQY